MHLYSVEKVNSSDSETIIWSANNVRECDKVVP